MTLKYHRRSQIGKKKSVSLEVAPREFETPRCLVVLILTVKENHEPRQQRHNRKENKTKRNRNHYCHKIITMDCTKNGEPTDVRVLYLDLYRFFTHDNDGSSRDERSVHASH